MNAGTTTMSMPGMPMPPGASMPPGMTMPNMPGSTTTLSGGRRRGRKGATRRGRKGATRRGRATRRMHGGQMPENAAANNSANAKNSNTAMGGANMKNRANTMMGGQMKGMESFQTLTLPSAAGAAPAMSTGTRMGGGARRGIPAIGSKAQVYHGTAHHTSGGLTKKDLMKTKNGRIVSKKKHALGKKALRRLVKAGYKAKKGTFKLFRK